MTEMVHAERPLETVGGAFHVFGALGVTVGRESLGQKSDERGYEINMSAKEETGRRRDSRPW